MTTKKEAEHSPDKKNERKNPAPRSVEQKQVVRDAKTGQFSVTGPRKAVTSVVESRTDARTHTAEKPAGAVDGFLERFTSREDVKDILEDWAK
ncbi:MAG: hypothetical protein QOF51_3870 [Chloroflexota bacterium]|jgi:hypothetical protein|nr:hypothetical protein [Chloroflexota bacterium]